jgi:hypothetical protein
MLFCVFTQGSCHSSLFCWLLGASLHTKQHIVMLRTRCSLSRHACALVCVPQIAALMERCKRLEEEAAEKGRTADALRRKLAFNGPAVASSGSAGSLAMAAQGSAAAAANRPGSAASYSSYAAGQASVGSSFRGPAGAVVGAGAPAGGAYGTSFATGQGYGGSRYSFQQAYVGSPRASALSGGVGAGIGSYTGVGSTSSYHSPTKVPLLSGGAFSGGVLGAQSPGGSSTCSAAPGGMAALRRSWAASAGNGSPTGQGYGGL